MTRTLPNPFLESRREGDVPPEVEAKPWIADAYVLARLELELREIVAELRCRRGVGAGGSR